jgi:pimeloyl-ACP methyl ester carboxylesterase
MMLSLAVGCGSGQPYVTEPRLEKGLVIVLSGIEGRGPLNEAICRGLDEGGVDLAIENYEWATRMGLVINLRAEQRNRNVSVDLADRIVRYKMQYPGNPVYLVGQSGGGAIAAWTAEAMPVGEPVNGVVMIAPSLSPEYMLDRALANVEEGIVNFHSEGDWMLLGLGTTIAGTMDGKHTSSAGKGGFEVPQRGTRRRLYRKLHQIGWTKEMARTGHSGGHMSSSASGFVAKYIAPLIRASAWNAYLIEDIREGKGPQAVRAGGQEDRLGEPMDWVNP